jgi:hypothetical protein
LEARLAVIILPFIVMVRSLSDLETPANRTATDQSIKKLAVMRD